MAGAAAPGRGTVGRRAEYLRSGLSIPLLDRQLEAPVRLCPLCGAEQYQMDQSWPWHGRRICGACLSRLEEEED